MDTSSPVYHALLARRREIAGNIQHLEQCIAKARHDLVHMDATLEIMGFDVPVERKRPKQSGTAGLFHRNELPRLILEMLRGAPDGLLACTMAETISRDKGWDTADKRFQVALTDKIGRVAYKMKDRHDLACESSSEGQTWRLS